MERYQKAVNALGGNAALESLPQYFKDRLSEAKDPDSKAMILEAIVEVKSWNRNPSNQG